MSPQTGGGGLTDRHARGEQRGAATVEEGVPRQELKRRFIDRCAGAYTSRRWRKPVGYVCREG